MLKYPIFWVVCLVVLVNSPWAQEKNTRESLNAIYQSGIANFNSDDFVTASSNFTRLIDEVPKCQLEPIYDTLGSAYFNAKRIGIFQLYLAKYLKSFCRANVTFALAQSYPVPGNANLATTLAKNLEAHPLYREQSSLFRATASKSTGNVDDAIWALEIS